MVPYTDSLFANTQVKVNKTITLLGYHVPSLSTLRSANFVDTQSSSLFCQRFRRLGHSTEVRLADSIVSSLGADITEDEHFIACQVLKSSSTVTGVLKQALPNYLSLSFGSMSGVDIIDFWHIYVGASIASSVDFGYLRFSAWYTPVFLPLAKVAVAMPAKLHASLEKAALKEVKVIKRPAPTAVQCSRYKKSKCSNGNPAPPPVEPVQKENLDPRKKRNKKTGTNDQLTFKVLRHGGQPAQSESFLVRPRDNSVLDLSFILN
ncbi:hypothetical protein C8R43DRAFT_955150 [Mycena crocata]|nr:hypothetical protein C8R43DRAFT_955150 [Mycena crocata]